MFFPDRATQAEYFDSPDRPQPEIAEFYASLARMNGSFDFSGPFRQLLPKLLGLSACRTLRLLDLGGGDGTLGALLSDWAKQAHGWDWRFTNLDLSVSALKLGSGNRVAGSVLALPFHDSSFDVVVASQMTHHLNEPAEIERHFREAWRVARQAILFSDLHRGPILYALLWISFKLRRYPKQFEADALLSVRRGFRLHELRSFAAAAGIGGARARLYYGSRVLLEARKG